MNLPARRSALWRLATLGLFLAGALSCFGLNCFQAHCNLLQECSCSDGTCPLSGLGCNIPPLESCADLCKAHGGLASPGTINPSCFAGTCAGGGAPPAAFQGFFHHVDAGADNADNFRLFDGGGGYEMNVTCDSVSSLSLTWCVMDAGELLVHNAPFALQPDGTLLDVFGQEWSPGAVCPSGGCVVDAGNPTVVPCSIPTGWDGGF